MEQEFWDSFCDGSLDAANFNHRAHLFAAFICINMYGKQAPEKFCFHLKNFTRIKGAEEKFHFTLSYFATLLIRSRTKKGQNFQSFLEGNPDLLFNFKEMVDQHYSQHILEKPSSIYSWIPPDKIKP